MYLTKFQINTQKRDARRLLSNPQKLYIAIMSSFPNNNIETPHQTNTLWRLDELFDNTTLYIYSTEKPELNHLVTQAGWNITKNWATTPYKPTIDNIKINQNWSFTLTANPQNEQKTTAKTTQTQYLWLENKAKQHGFEINKNFDTQLQITKRQNIKFSQQNTTTNITKITYQGLLKITDPNKFKTTLQKGIGTAKEYGCGLLTIQKP